MIMITKRDIELVMAANNYTLDIRLGYSREMDETDKLIYNAFVAGAEWGTEHLRDSTKMIDKSLEEAANEFANQDCVTFISRKKGFIAGAEWQKEQMLKDAVKGKVNQDGFLELSNGEVIDICPTLKRCALGLHIGDKVRIIVLKDEE